MTPALTISAYRRRAAKAALQLGIRCRVPIYTDALVCDIASRALTYELVPCNRPAIAPFDDRRPDGGAVCEGHALPVANPVSTPIDHIAFLEPGYDAW